jgi:hypothetical protein
MYDTRNEPDDRRLTPKHVVLREEVMKQVL